MHRRALDGRLQSALKWDTQVDTPTLWDLDLGLFAQLPQALGDQAQFRSLVAVLKHFVETVWNPETTTGLCLYRGPADYPSLGRDETLQDWLAERGLSRAGREQLELYRRDVAVEFIDLLTTHLPPELTAYVELDVSHIEDPFQRLRLLAKDRYEHLKVLPLGLPEHVVMDREGQRPGLGLMIPEKEYCKDAPRLARCIQSLDAQQQPYRVVSEAQLTMEWDGLDEIIVGELTVSDLGWRQLEGFRAAGGQIRVV